MGKHNFQQQTQYSLPLTFSDWVSSPSWRFKGVSLLTVQECKVLEPLSLLLLLLLLLCQNTDEFAYYCEIR
jgi:hypothetical protein